MMRLFIRAIIPLVIYGLGFVAGFLVEWIHTAGESRDAAMRLEMSQRQTETCLLTADTAIVRLEQCAKRLELRDIEAAAK